jgi:hypothetical protein
MRKDVIYAHARRHLRRIRHLWQILHPKGKSRIIVPSAVARGLFPPAWVENTGGGPCARTSSMRTEVIYAPGPPPRVSCMRGQVIYGTDVMFGC